VLVAKQIFETKVDLALTLLVAQVLADHHDPTVTADHLALLADLLDARLNLHVSPISCMCAAGHGRAGPAT
jgi:hypothetical protein